MDVMLPKKIRKFIAGKIGLGYAALFVSRDFFER